MMLKALIAHNYPSLVFEDLTFVQMRGLLDRIGDVTGNNDESTQVSKEFLREKYGY